MLHIVTFNLCATSQTIHISKWIIGNYWFDFSANPTTFTQLESKFYNTDTRLARRLVYIDSEGVVKLLIIDNYIYDNEGNIIYYADQTKLSYLFPLPNSDNIVCVVGNNGSIYEIDVETKVVSTMQNTNFNSFKAVYNANCSYIWLIKSDNSSIKRQLLKSSGVTLAYETKLGENDYPKSE